MLLEFTVRNYLSIRDEMKISFVATALKENLAERNDPMPVSETGLSLLRSAVIYGANASGKTNLLKAFAFYKRFILDSFRNSQAGEAVDVENFRLNASSAKAPTAMEAVFCDGGFICRYGFEATASGVLKEWLYQRANVKRGKEVEIFYRSAEGTRVRPKSRLLQELSDKKMIRDNALLLSTAAQFNEPKAVAVMQWLNDTRVLFCSEGQKLWRQALKHLDDPKVRSRIVEFAKHADLGIEGISNIDGSIVSNHAQFDDQGRQTTDIGFSFAGNESEGTIKYISLSYPVIDALDNGKRLIVDNLDAKLHPLLVRKIVALFISSRTNPKGAQLLFTAHDTFLLGAGLFRRDQIWFTQKDSFGATGLYSLAEYKVRGGSPYEKDYLRGKYGAIPVFPFGTSPQ